jgi:hypothetical protein
MIQPQAWIHEGLWQIRRQKLARGEVQLCGKDLKKIYPELIGPGKVRCGVYFPEGWTILVHLLLKQIRLHNTYGDPTSGKPITILQIKEKFGGLRLYIGGGYTKAQEPSQLQWPDLGRVCAQINFVEEYTEHICQVDGRTTDLQVTTPGWVGIYASGNLPNTAGFVPTHIPMCVPLDVTRPLEQPRGVSNGNVIDTIFQQRKVKTLTMK